MPWYWPFGRRRAADIEPLDPRVEMGASMTAAASVIAGNDRPVDRTGRTGRYTGSAALLPQTEAWQRELWDYLDDLGEFGIAVTWRANMISRIRLRAARLVVGSDEPEIVDTGPAAELVNDLAGGIGGQSELMSTFSTYLDVTGEGWLTGEKVDGETVWLPRSSDEIRLKSGIYEVIDRRSTPGNVIWRPLANGGNDWFVTRVWRSNRRFRHLAWSPAKAARSAMRELELANRRIQAQYLSRLATAGIIVMPDEFTFPTREEFKDSPDPFMDEWIELASESIKRPGTASSVVPLPMRVPGEWVDKIQHLSFSTEMDEKMLEMRDSAIKRVTALVNVPTDLLLNSGNVNHWGLSQLEESAVKIYVSPDVETIVNGFTIGYLHPMLRAARVEDWDEWVVWYDPSEITIKPDRSDDAQDAYDRLEISGEAYRRAKGLNENDAPDEAEVQRLVLKRLAINPTIGFLALNRLTGLDVDELALPAGEVDDADDVIDEDAPDDDATSEPGTRGDDRPADGRDAPARTAAGIDVERDALSILQANSQHIVEFQTGNMPRLQHPDICRSRQFSCSFTHATYHGIDVHPGQSGRYECWLTTDGEFAIGRRVFDRFSDLPAVPIGGKVNGHAR